MRKIEKLEVAGLVAPVLRAKKAHRKIYTTAPDGTVMRVITEEELAMSLLRAEGIDFDVDVTELRVCENTSCGKAYRPRKKSGLFAKGCTPECCKEAKKQKDRTYLEANREKKRAYLAEYNRKNKEKLNKQNRDTYHARKVNQ